jgi:hypothetical protein
MMEILIWGGIASLICTMFYLLLCACSPRYQREEPDAISDIDESAPVDPIAWGDSQEIYTTTRVLTDKQVEQCRKTRAALSKPRQFGRVEAK